MKREDRGEIPVEVENVASFSECTGLMPSLPGSEAEDDASASLYAVHRAAKRGKTRKE